jgi:hypothetical protein
MVEALINLIDQFGSQILILQIGLMIVILATLSWVWLYNKRKYQNLKHQIPANVVKTYLDTIINNSSALKSSLFRGHGLDVDTDGIPSVLPLSSMTGGSSVDIADGEDSAIKNAEIAKLRSELKEKSRTILDLDGNLTGLNGEIQSKDERIAELERMLAESGTGESSGTEANSAELEALTQERDQLQEKLQEYSMLKSF